MEKYYLIVGLKDDGYPSGHNPPASYTTRMDAEESAKTMFPVSPAGKTTHFAVVEVQSFVKPASPPIQIIPLFDQRSGR